MLSFKEDNKEVVFNIYAVTDIHNYPMTTTYMIRAEGDVEYEYLDMVEYKHFDHIYWEVVYNFIMTFSVLFWYLLRELDIINGKAWF